MTEVHSSSGALAPLDPTEYPARVGTMFIEDLVCALHTRPDDLDEGDLLARVRKHDAYALIALDLTRVTLDEFSLDEIDVDDYAARASGPSATPLPPIVFDSTNGSMLDGLHRANAAHQLGAVQVWAYVPVPA